MKEGVVNIYIFSEGKMTGMDHLIKMMEKRENIIFKLYERCLVTPIEYVYTRGLSV